VAGVETVKRNRNPSILLPGLSPGKDLRIVTAVTSTAPPCGQAFERVCDTEAPCLSFEASARYTPRIAWRGSGEAGVTVNIGANRS
jgi:hypothetical protein